MADAVQHLLCHVPNGHAVGVDRTVRNRNVQQGYLLRHDFVSVCLFPSALQYPGSENRIVDGEQDVPQIRQPKVATNVAGTCIDDP